VETIRRDTVFIPYHWAGAAAANIMTVDALDPTSKIPEFKVCACRVERGEHIDAIAPPAVPPGASPDVAGAGGIGDERPPTAPQGRGTAEA
jgi:assimilatory nitrate reductase catalytic subunit